MRLIITFLMAWCLSMGAYAATAPDAKQITQELEQAKAAKPAQPETVESLQAALNALEERKGSLERAQQYQQVIDNFPKLSQTLRAQLNNLRDEPRDASRVTGLAVRITAGGLAFGEVAEFLLLAQHRDVAGRGGDCVCACVHGGLGVGVEVVTGDDVLVSLLPGRGERLLGPVAPALPGDGQGIG